MKNITVCNLIKTCLQFDMCVGVKNNTISNSVIMQAIPKSKEALANEENDELVKPLVPYENITFLRTKKCYVFVPVNSDGSTSQCEFCIDQDITISKQEKIKTKRQNQPAKLKAPVSATGSHRIKLTLQQHRLKCNQLEKRLQKMQEMLIRSNLKIDETLNKDFINLFNSNQKKVTPFMKLFWEQQQKLFGCAERGARYHPMIIRYCLSLYAKSSSTYEEIRNSGILRLPSSRTLRDYKNVIKPGVGFQQEIIEDLKKFTNSYTGPQRYVTLIYV